MPIEKAVGKVTSELARWYGVDAGTISVGDRADIAIVNPEGLDDSLDDYAEAPMPCFDGMPRMVRRNDLAVSATIIAGKVAYREGSFTDGFGESERYGSFLRASS